MAKINDIYAGDLMCEEMQCRPCEEENRRGMEGAFRSYFRSEIEKLILESLDQSLEYVESQDFVREFLSQPYSQKG